MHTGNVGYHNLFCVKIEISQSNKYVASRMEMIASLLMPKWDIQLYTFFGYFEFLPSEPVIKQQKNKCVYSVIMDCYSKMGDFKSTLQLFYSLRAAKEIGIDETLYCMAINACAHCGLTQEAMDIYEGMNEKEKRNPYIVSAMIDCLARNNHLQKAERMYDAFCLQTDEINDKTKRVMLSSILSACSVYGDSLRAQRIQTLIHENAEFKFFL